jgi:CheY-like chemotaxis protein
LVELERICKMHTKKILIVDDERDISAVLARHLTARGHPTITADNGEDAILLARSQRPGLVILDILMPEMGGQEVAAVLKQDPHTQDIPVIFLSCLYNKEEEAKRGHIVGGNVMFAKPYDPEELVSAIERLL